MDEEDQNKKHVVADKTQQEKVEGKTHKPEEEKNPKSWWDKLKELFK